jgi:hypothetical protein
VIPSLSVVLHITRWIMTTSLTRDTTEGTQQQQTTKRQTSEKLTTKICAPCSYTCELNLLLVWRLRRGGAIPLLLPRTFQEQLNLQTLHIIA